MRRLGLQESLSELASAAKATMRRLTSADFHVSKALLGAAMDFGQLSSNGFAIESAFCA
jgi:hypothetical protein